MADIHKGGKLRGTLRLFFVLFLLFPSVYAIDHYGKTRVKFDIPFFGGAVDHYAKARIIFHVPSEPIESIDIQECYEITRIGDNIICINRNKDIIMIIVSTTTATVGFLMWPKKDDRRVDYEEDISNILGSFAVYDARSAARDDKYMY